MLKKTCAISLSFNIANGKLAELHFGTVMILLSWNILHYIQTAMAIFITFDITIIIRIRKRKRIMKKKKS